MFQTSLKKKIATVALSAAAAVTLVPSVASAHTNYCGHGSTTHWATSNPHKITFVRHWNDYGDPSRHQHTVKVTYFWGAYSIYKTHGC